MAEGFLPGWLWGGANEPVEQARGVPAQPVELAAEAVAGGCEEQLEYADGAGQDPPGRGGERCAGQGTGCQRQRREAEAKGTQRLREAWRNLRFELMRRPESECAANERPRPAEDRVAGSEVRADAERHADRRNDE